VLLQSLGCKDDARKLFQRALQVFITRLGENHPHVKMARENLAAV